MNTQEQTEALERSLSLLQTLTNEQVTPRTLRKEANQIVHYLKDDLKSLDLKCSEVILKLEGFSEDPNIPAYSRTLIWQIIGNLSTLS